MTMKTCNEKSKLATARHTQEIEKKTEKNQLQTTQQTPLTNPTLNPDVLDTLYNNSQVFTTIIIGPLWGNLEK